MKINWRSLRPTAIAVTLAAAVVVAGTTLPTVHTCPDPNPSGLPWRSGAHTGSRAPDYNTFATWRGRPLDVNLQYSDRSRWASIEKPWSLAYSYPGETIIGQPGWPERTGGNHRDCAAGSYDAHWRTYGANLVALGRPTLMTELMWEANGNWMDWAAVNTDDYAACYRRIVTAVRATAPTARFLWTINAHSRGTTGDPFSAYPGDEYVDVIGIDAYDHYPKSTSQAQFDAQAGDVAGITWTYNRAVARGKQLAVPEWGVVGATETADLGGDNPVYVAAMLAWFRAHPGIFMEAYFDANPNAISPAQVNAGATAHPKAAAAYRAGLDPGATKPPA